MTRRLALAAATAVMALLAVAPATAAPAPDPLRTLGGDSPLCAHPRTAAARRDCDASGSIEHPYPLDRYRFDWFISTGITHFEGNLASTLQWLVSMLWQAVLWAAKGILLIFQWAFSLDLLGDAMRPVTTALDRLHTQVFGPTWSTAALLALGLWGIWNGLVRRRGTATAGGLVVAVTMMAGALALIAQPAATVGSATRMVNKTKLSILAGATHGSVRTPARSLEDTSRQIFDTIVLRPWCAVEFGDVAWCLRRPPGAHLSPGEHYLSHDPGSGGREAEYKLLADRDYDFADVATDDDIDKDDKAVILGDPGYLKAVARGDRTKVAMQQKDRTLFRTGLVLLVLVGVTGWVALLGYLAVQSLFQALLGLVLLLGAPVMLFAPAFGERGRRTFGAWALRLLATIVSGALYALLLAITLTVAQLVGDLGVSTNWMAAWLVQLVFLWGVFFKRRDVLSRLSGNTHREAGSGHRWSELQAKRQTIQQAAAPALAVAGAPAAVLVGAGRGAAQTARDRRADTDRAVQGLAAEQLADRGRQRLQTTYDAHHERLAAHDTAQRALPEMRRRRDKLERELGSPRLDTDRRAQVEQDKGKLTGQIKSTERRLMPRAEEGVARRFIETADRNLVEGGERFTDQQVDLAVQGLHDDLEAGAGPDDTRHAWRTETYRPGIPEADLAKLDETQRAALHQRIDDDLRRDRDLLAALTVDPRQERPTRAGRRAAQRQLPSAPVAAAQLEHRAQRLAQTDAGALHNVRARNADRRARRARTRAADPPPPSAP